MNDHWDKPLWYVVLDVLGGKGDHWNTVVVTRHNPFVALVAINQWYRDRWSKWCHESTDAVFAERERLGVEVDFSLEQSEAFRSKWPEPFTPTYQVANVFQLEECGTLDRFLPWDELDKNGWAPWPSPRFSIWSDIKDGHSLAVKPDVPEAEK